MTMSDPRSYGNAGGARSDFVNALERAIREKPVSAALIGMGALWLFMGGSRTTLFGGGGRKSIFTGAARRAEQVGGAVAETAAGMGSSVRRVGDATADAASRVAGAIQQASNVAGDAASRTGTQAAAAISGAYSTAADLTSGAVESVSDVGANWGRTLKQNLSDLFERQPMLIGGVGLAIGAVIATSLRASDAEKKLMAGASHFVRDAVADKAAEIKELAGAGLQEVKAQGLTLQAAGEALHAMGDRWGVRDHR